MTQQIELEQKFLFDPADAEKLIDIFVAKYEADSRLVRQFYNDFNGESYRYRCIGNSAVREVKRDLVSFMDYTMASETSSEIGTEFFDAAFERAKKRLQKFRYTAVRIPRTEDYPATHTLTLDLFVTKREINTPRLSNGMRVYAVVAESETLLKPDTKFLDLDFRLPKTLRPLCLRTLVTRRSTDMMFGSKKLIDTSKAISTALASLRGAP